MTQREFTPDTQTILREVHRLLSYHQLSGIESYPATEEIRGLLRMKVGIDLPQDVMRQRPSVVTGRAERTVRPVELPNVKREPNQRIHVSTLHDIRDEVMTCTGCTLSENRVVSVPGGGADKAKLLIVGDWLALAAGQKSPAGCVFGIEQDRMLGKMLEAIHLSKTDVFVTNVIKCGIPDSCQPKADNVHACVSFLHRQIVSLQPEVILSMGMIATRALLNRREPLSKLRGQLLVCNDPNNRKIPLIATYHPTFLLQNPEMKKATWFDLQLLAKQLGLA